MFQTPLVGEQCVPSPGQPCLHTCWRMCVEVRQRSVAPKQKQRVQPLGLVASREKVPRRHWSHLGPCTFSWGEEGRADQPAGCGSPPNPPWLAVMLLPTGQLSQKHAEDDLQLMG